MATRHQQEIQQYSEAAKSFAGRARIAEGREWAQPQLNPLGPLFNPYYSVYLSFFGGQWATTFVPNYGEAYHAREWMAKMYAWAVPEEAALAAILKAAPKIVEMGAGTGYWAAMLAARGGDVLAYDALPYENHFVLGNYYPVSCGTADKVGDHADRALMLCWPDYGTPFASACLRQYRGDTVIYIGEGDGGCTGDDEFHERLAAEWTEESFTSIPQWPGIHDGLFIYRRGKANA